VPPAPIAGGAALGEQIAGVVLTELDVAEAPGARHHVGPEPLGHRDDRDSCGIAPRTFDALTRDGEPIGQIAIVACNTSVGHRARHTTSA
jgi:hypothetical protein